MIRLLPVLALAGSFVVGSVVLVPMVRPGSPASDLRAATVGRVDFRAVVVAAGRVESLSNTEIRCSLERVGSAAPTTILSLIADGSTVKEGEVLGELDSSAYLELVRQQEINVQQSRAAYRQAELDLEVARIALTSYREGELRQTDRLMLSQIALADADLTRQEDRLNWTRRMFEKGYVALAQVATDEQTLQRARLSLGQNRRSLENYRRFTAPIQIKILESAIEGATASLGYQTIRLKREEERLALYQRMVESCVIRAPHDGFVIYANRAGREAEIYPGATVRQRQTLFSLPDLTRMEVQTLLHETIVNQVNTGMPVKVRVEALPDRTFTGIVTSVSPLPLTERKSQTGNTDVTYFLGHVRLTSSTEGLSPGMSAELEILTSDREKVLAVPYESIANDGERYYCTVLHPDRRERRPINIGETNREWIEILDGLAEGEEVVMDGRADSSEIDPNPAARRFRPLAGF